VWRAGLSAERGGGEGEGGVRVEQQRVSDGPIPVVEHSALGLGFNALKWKANPIWRLAYW
jgi:hypothetical protein